MSEALEVVRCSCSVTLEKLLVLFQPELIQYFSEKNFLFCCLFHGSVKNDYLGSAGGSATLYGSF